MPYKKGQFQKSYSPPSPNVARKLWNSSAMSEDVTKQYPDLASAWAGREIEMPAEAAATRNVRPMNWIENKFSGDDTVAMTWPWGTIAINPDRAKQQKQNLGEVLAHELVHVGQNSNPMNLLRNAYHNLKPYGAEQPREAEAFEYTARRPVRTKDISLDKPVRRK